MICQQFMALKIKELSKPEKVIYVVIESGICLEVTNFDTLETKSVSTRKRAYQGIKYLSDKIQKLKDFEIMQFLSR
jgi:hypothetical protein